ncbi:bactofilin family protein [Neisseria sp. Ec49-e6-T10]|uniref:bactofilin family protein n=1 Tax=Neisseria sp. Ec49-e6-T10 TaxID=3140744 RepID=UPI003EBE3A2F
MGIFHKQNNLGNDKQMTTISANTECQGTLDSHNTIQIDGIFEGKATSKTRIIISENGTVTGDVHAEEIYVYGKLEGQIYAEKVLIGEKGHVNATIHSEYLVIMEGGQYVGEKKEKSHSTTNNTLTKPQPNLSEQNLSSTQK